ncbi:scavenger mRNA decapping enzyme [Leucogyrophana mollusca]|uniref:Scavenger mRNA decapping enzyme n=1 Tax=Leucogyrophana mollusca TaxID=85980 RepID=A0ACB8BXA9_9AGAM|nr:scavenger mRNA decapping enzyme [Leucogyrophana mollusca]
MADSVATSSSVDLQAFEFERVLDENPLTVLGTLPSTTQRLPAILRIEKTALASSITPADLSSTKLIENNDIYSWHFGWLKQREDVPDLKINVVFPATEVHIRKYSKQDIILVHETPQLYARIVKPYIDSFPASRTQWVSDILSGASEASKILFSSPAFALLPDMKWDLTTVPALYLVALARDPALRSLRDLRAPHVPLLEAIRAEAHRVVWERWGLERGGVRLYVHYQPSYYRFHVHVVHASQAGLMGMTVGQAHLLDDIISMLSLAPSILEDMTFTYGLGNQHGLYAPLVAAQAEVPFVATAAQDGH